MHCINCLAECNSYIFFLQVFNFFFFFFTIYLHISILQGLTKMVQYSSLTKFLSLSNIFGTRSCIFLQPSVANTELQELKRIQIDAGGLGELTNQVEVEIFFPYPVLNSLSKYPLPAGRE